MRRRKVRNCTLFVAKSKLYSTLLKLFLVDVVAFANLPQQPHRASVVEHHYFGFWSFDVRKRKHGVNHRLRRHARTGVKSNHLNTFLNKPYKGNGSPLLLKNNGIVRPYCMHETILFF